MVSKLSILKSAKLVENYCMTQFELLETKN